MYAGQPKGCQGEILAREREGNSTDLWVEIEGCYHILPLGNVP